jgi:predicted RNase H-like HicB family nuclease
MATRTYTVILEPVEGIGFCANVPALPCCFTQGGTMEEVVSLAKEAIEGFLEVLSEKGEPIPVEGSKVTARAVRRQISR